MKESPSPDKIFSSAKIDDIEQEVEQLNEEVKEEIKEEIKEEEKEEEKVDLADQA